MARMREFYVNEVAPALNKKFGYKSVMQIPKLDKIVVNVGCGEARDNQKMIDAIWAILLPSPVRSPAYAGLRSR